MKKSLRPTLLIVAALLTAGPAARAQAPAPAGKTYTLFEGDNISVGKDADVSPVVDVSGGAWVIRVNGTDTVLSGKSGPVNMRAVAAQKLTELSASVANFKATGAFTWANDPAVKLTRALANSAEVSAGASAAANQSAAAAVSAEMAASSGGSSDSGGKGGATGTSTNLSSGSNSMNATGADNDLGLTANQANTEGYDTLEVAFDISSAHPLPTPYLVTFTWFRDPGAGAGLERKLVFAKALEPIGTTPSKVKFTIEGFPVGYVLVNMEIHLYDRGQEIATNVAPKRKSMTPDEAFSYVREKYIASHKNATLPAQPVMGDLPADLPTHVARGEYASPVYVKVSKDGLADEAFADQACTKKIDDPYLATVVQSIRFKPALDHGNPVDSVSQVAVASLRI